MSAEIAMHVMHDASRVMSVLATYGSIDDLVVFAIACCCILGIYLLLQQIVHTEKGRAWIVMLMSSAMLSIFGTYFVIDAQAHDSWTYEYIYSETFLSRCVLLFFLASNIMDLLLGIYHYPKFLDPFSTIAHHAFYISFILVLLSQHYSRGFMLCFFMEIPTFVLSLGTIWPQLRSDTLFGASFVATRLLYNVFLARTLYLISPEGKIWRVCCAVLGLHSYWFSKWTSKQGKELLQHYFGTAMTVPAGKAVAL
jgi:hypothetical protein